ncbi:DUF488 domain-containing protein [Phocaeicola sp.]
MTLITIKRVYEAPSPNDGYRVLVDRLWPRGMKREDLKFDYWAKELTPSNDLRKWFHADVEKRWGAFADMYQKELERSADVAPFIHRIKPFPKVTLLYASKNEERNHARVLEQYLGTLF